MWKTNQPYGGWSEVSSCRFADEICECVDGQEAVSAYNLQKPDLVLMDIRMDGVDGIQATRQIKAADPDAKIIIVTDYDDDALRQAAMRAGAAGYALKENLLDFGPLAGSAKGTDECRQTVEALACPSGGTPIPCPFARVPQDVAKQYPA